MKELGRELDLFARAMRAIDRGFEPIAEQLAAMETYHANLDAQRERAGFISEASFEEWLNEDPAPADCVWEEV